MSKSARNYWSQFRSEEDKRRDAEWDIHEAGDCDWATCPHCIAAGEAIGRFVDEELDDDERRCPICDSTDFIYEGDRQMCATCGK